MRIGRDLQPSWYHTVQFPGGIVTPGDYDHRPLVAQPRWISLRHLHEIIRRQPSHVSFRTGIDIARRRLGSSVKLVNCSNYELEPDRVGIFDLVHGRHPSHLRDPVVALQRLRAVTSGELLFADCFDPSLDELGTGSGLTPVTTAGSET
jgi:hypothetical protein